MRNLEYSIRTIVASVIASRLEHPGFEEGDFRLLGPSTEATYCNRDYDEGEECDDEPATDTGAECIHDQTEEVQSGYLAEGEQQEDETEEGEANSNVEAAAQPATPSMGETPSPLAPKTLVPFCLRRSAGSRIGTQPLVGREVLCYKVANSEIRTGRITGDGFILHIHQTLSDLRRIVGTSVRIQGLNPY